MSTLNFAVGVYVRSYDFPHTRSTFIEGTIMSVARDCYSIKVERVVHDGVDKSTSRLLGERVEAPVNGLESIFGNGKTSGVEMARRPAVRADY